MSEHRLDVDDSQVAVSNENFELWLRMATDNKINTDNSWNFALIDYFHDFSMLRDGDSVNFQRASTTLDGCMKIYSNRVDSAAKDTGTLLSTLNIKAKRAERTLEPEGIVEDGNGEYDKGGFEDDDPLEENVGNRHADPNVIDTPGRNKTNSIRKKKDERQTVSSFNNIRIREQNRPVKPDPVFKNALTNFDEGGAKSLLNNILRISNKGKVVFDVADHANVSSDIENEENDPDPGLSENAKIYSETNAISFLKLQNFITFDIINSEFDICPSLDKLKKISNGNGDPAIILEGLGDVDVSLIEAEMMEGRHNNNLKDNFFNNDVDNEHDPNIFDQVMPDFDENLAIESDVGDQGGDTGDELANISKRTQYSIYMDGVENDEDDVGSNLTLNRLFEEKVPQNNIKFEPFNFDKLDQNDLKMLDIYDDIGRRSNVYWKIARLKRHANASTQFLGSEKLEFNEEDGTSSEFLKSKRLRSKRSNKVGKVKEKVTIDFMSDEADISVGELFEPTDYLSKIMLSERERKSGRHIIDDDGLFTIKKLTCLNLKPDQLCNSVLFKKIKYTHKDKDDENIQANEEYFAQVYDNNKIDVLDNSIISDPIDPESDINIFDDLDPNGVEGFDMPLFGPTDFEILQSQSQSQPQSQSSDIYSKGPIEYARRSKKVDVKLLKQNIWRSIEEISTHKKKRAASHFEVFDDHTNVPTEKLVKTNQNLDPSNQSELTAQSEIVSDVTPTVDTVLSENIEETEATDAMKFTQVVEIMSSKYNTKVKKDLSTSFCFICLLHLANEQGLTLETKENYEDIIIHK